MKAIIFDFKRFSIHDGPGIRQTVFFKGCPLSCWWCHNPESQDIKSVQSARKYILEDKKYETIEQLGKIMSLDEVMNSIIKDEIYYDESGGGVTFSGGEPLMQHEFLLKLTEKCNEQKIHTALDTTGFANEKIFKRFFNKIDLFLFDLKHMNSDEHKKYTGVPNETILNNLKLLNKNKQKTIIRFPVIPSINDSQKNIDETKSFLNTLENIREIALLPYHVIANHKYDKFSMRNKMEQIKAIETKDVLYLKKEFEEIGFKVTIGG